jgi:hypothetical protein
MYAVRPPDGRPVQPRAHRDRAAAVHTGPPAGPVARRAEPPAELPAARGAAAPPADDEPPRPRSPTEARDRLRERLRRSGRSSEPWMARIDQLFADWRTAAPQLAGRATVGPVDCYRQGCSVELAGVDRAAFDAINESLPAVTAFLEFPGWRHRTGVVTRADGGVTATWFFMRPDGPVAGRE